MRISDWSSDVCSSDLLVNGAGMGRGCLASRIGNDEDVWEATSRLRQCHGLRVRRLWHVVRCPFGGAPWRPGDRKRGVEGKSVSVRVDIGERRIVETTNAVEMSHN